MRFVEFFSVALIEKGLCQKPLASTTVRVCGLDDDVLLPSMSLSFFCAYAPAGTRRVAAARDRGDGRVGELLPPFARV